ncbi:MAG TPA: hydrogenase expression/formation protein HypE, partial [Candidatus Binatia bacterium]|nr:hydrogenase expression/formation protein HypE [Candidatus Binatia bacterium]
MMKDGGDFDPAGMICPAPLLDYKHIILGHGSGGKLTGDLVRKLFLPAFTNECLDRLDDQAVFEIQGTRVAFTT